MLHASAGGGEGWRDVFARQNERSTCEECWRARPSQSKTRDPRVKNVGGPVLSFGLHGTHMPKGHIIGHICKPVPEKEMVLEVLSLLLKCCDVQCNS